ncbi:MAG: hypothetical protein WA921_08050 [Ahrensia sp.]
MFRFLFRLFALFLLAFALTYVVIDASRSIADSKLVFTAFETTLFQLIPNQFEQFAAWRENGLSPVINDIVLATAFKAPTSLIAAILALLFYGMSRKTGRSSGRFSLN